MSTGRRGLRGQDRAQLLDMTRPDRHHMRARPNRSPQLPTWMREIVQLG
jgi:hypothetical protein